MLMHYLHAQYLIEKAFVGHLKGSSDKSSGVMKTLLLLIYANRVYEKPSKDRNAHPTYPLMFSNMWKHLFVDALLPADHVNEVQIHDINLYDSQAPALIHRRIQPTSSKLLSDSLERALNAIDFNPINKWYQEIELLQNYLSTDSADGGELQKLLDKRLQEVLANADNGAISCLKKTVKESFGERKSLRSQFMANLAQNIQFLLVELLLVIFENRNIRLYCNKDINDKQINKLFLQILEEPKIVRLSHKEDNSKVSPKDELPNGNQFPFSSHIHSLFSSIRSYSFNVFERTKQSSPESVTFIGFLVTHIRNWIQTLSLNWLNDLSEEMKKRLLHDIVHLEGNDIFGLRRFSGDRCVILIKNVCSFVELAAADAMQQFGRSGTTIQSSTSNSAEKGSSGHVKKASAGNVSQEEENDGNSSDEDIWAQARAQQEMESSAQYFVAVEDEKREDDEIIDFGDEEEAKEEKQEKINPFQVSEIYAVLWSQREVLCDFIDVLSAFQSRSTRELDKISQSFFLLFTSIQTKDIWDEKLNVYESVGKILIIVLEYLEKSLETTAADKMKDKLNYLIYISQAFHRLVQWLHEGCKNKNFTREVSQRWDLLRLCVLCVIANNHQIQSIQFISLIRKQFELCQFDNFESLNTLLKHVGQALKQNAFDSEKKDEALQWLVQSYVSTFVLKDGHIQNPQITYQIRDDFSEKFIKWIVGEKIEFVIEANQFTKIEAITQILNLLRIKDKYKNIRQFMVNQTQTCNLNSEFAVLLIRAEEQSLHFQGHMHHQFLTQQDKVNWDEMAQLSKKLVDRIKENVIIDILLTVAECKMWTYYLSHYLSPTLDGPFKYGSNGIEKELSRNRETYLSSEQCKAIGELYHVDKRKMTEMEWKIRQGLRYYLMVELWRRKGSQAALYLSDKKFKQLFEFDMQKLREQYTQVQTLFSNALKSQQLDWSGFERRHFVYLIANIFNEVYLKKGVKDTKMITTFLNSQLKSLDSSTARFWNFATPPVADKKDSHLICPDIRSQGRLSYLIAQFCCIFFYCCLLTKADSEYPPFKNFEGKATLEDVQMYRLGWHLIAVILSLPSSPFSILFHQPNAYKKKYLLAMPDDQNTSLLQAMKGYGAWLCPNDHIYFVDNCTRTKESGKCPTCNETIGNQALFFAHVAASGNRKLGIVQEDGTILPDDKGANRGTVKFQSHLLIPTGYVVMEGAMDVKCRNFDEQSIQIARCLVNLILFMHHLCAEKSDCSRLYLCLYFNMNCLLIY
ncbi:hypothetical protein RFI_38115 [Reticulomyxa filosa]|uniref:RZ-type domain-containing protein n=1 Tax=Reticulomyxa filosa TaxID=46433 RepID=X6LDF5_RETFI|nr:hypothetical protein RFI_38115 [Reticulomyxa filosa]|eukprot:ETN99365.1 hypothetical protein RFI_38115 [Reticulomyxa filosa]